MFLTKKLNQQVGQEYIWVAEYYKGFDAEFDLDTLSPKSFYDIDKENLVRFGLIGHKEHLFFEVFRGTFNINGKRIDIAYEENDKIYRLSNQNRYYKDIITYKEAAAEAFSGSVAKSTILGYYFGYKDSIMVEDVSFNLKIICSTPSGADFHYLQVSLSADRDLDGDLLFLSNEKIISSIPAPLNKGCAGSIDWVIK